MYDYIIIGAGVPSLVFAKYVLMNNFTCAIIEKSDVVGGKYSSFLYGEYTFDLGIHVLYTTNIQKIDSILENALPRDECSYLEGNRKDIAGLYWKGKLFQDNQYFSLNELEGLQHLLVELLVLRWLYY